MMQANPDEFIPIFANNPRELKAFLEHMSEVQPDSKQGVYDTLLELRLQNWAHEQDPQVCPRGLPSVRGRGRPWSPPMSKNVLLGLPRSKRSCTMKPFSC